MFLDLISWRLPCGVIAFKLKPEVFDNIPEFISISEIPPLLSGGRRSKTSKKALDLQLDAYKLYIKGWGVSAIASKLNRKISTVQSALELTGFVGLIVLPTFEEHLLDH